MLTEVTEDARVRAADGHAAWPESFNELFAQVAGCFSNAAVRRHGRAYVLGLLSRTERKNSWQLAEFAGDASPDGLQRLLNFSPWDEGACQDALCRYVIRELGDPGAVLAIDDTGFLKKGRMSAGAARQYTGTAGRAENCQAGVFLAYCAPDGSRALADRGLYIPEKRTQDRDRCKAAGIGDDVPFSTKPQLAKKMIGRAAEAGVPFKRVTGDEAYGGNPGPREWLEAQEIPYALTVACNAMTQTKAGAKRADELAALVPAGARERRSCADGSKGPRLYDWALVATDSGRHWLMVRRSPQPGEKGDLELAFYRCYPPRPVTLAELAAVAGARWGAEDCFAEAKNEAGLDHYQVRRYRAWYRHITLAMLAHAFLAVTAHAARPARTPAKPPGQAAASASTSQEPLKKGPDGCEQLLHPA